jgi:hypothetical protein
MIQYWVHLNNQTLWCAKHKMKIRPKKIRRPRKKKMNTKKWWLRVKKMTLYESCCKQIRIRYFSKTQQMKVL